MALLSDSASTGSKSPSSQKKTRSTSVSSAQGSATLETIQSLRQQIADLEAKEEERGELTKAQAAKLEELKAEIEELKKPKTPEPTPGTMQSEPAGRMAPWCPW